MSEETVVIVGAGHAGGQAAASLRQFKWPGHIVMAGEEAYLPYQRPPLSKGFLSGDLEYERLFLKPEAFYAQHDVDRVLEAEIASLDLEAKTVHAKNGEAHRFDKLILATGARVRRLTCPGADCDGVYYLRTIDDVRGIQARFREGARLVVVGGGYIGLEAAAVARKMGLDVTVLEAEDRVLARVAGPEVSAFYQDVHRDAGVDIRLGARVSEIAVEDGCVRACVLDGGEETPADLVIVGIGILPNAEIAAEAGLVVSNGIDTNEFAQTSHRDVYAIGDCANHFNPIYDQRMRLESVHNALEQAKTAAAHICGKEKPYSQVPWFWSDQYDLKLQTQGVSAGYDEAVVRGAPDARSFAVFYLKKGRLIATDAVNAPAEFLGSKALIAAGATPAPERLKDPDVPLKDLI